MRALIAGGSGLIGRALSEDLAGFREVIRPGAFAKTLQERDQVAYWSHDSAQPLGRRSEGTLVLTDSPAGLAIEIIPPDTTWGHDAVASIQRRDVQGFSFGFRVIRDRVTGEEEEVLRELLEVDLREVSPVTEPAYPATEAEARAILEASGVEFDATTSEPGEAHSDAGAGDKSRLRQLRRQRIQRRRDYDPRTVKGEAV